MDWGKLFLSAEGRIGRKDYWLGVLILLVLWWASILAHIFAPLIWLVLLYPWVCVIAKRLHDRNRSGWMILVPVVIGCIAMCGVLVAGGFALIGAFINALGDPHSDFVINWTGVLGALGLAAGFLALAVLVKLVFLVWVGAGQGDAGANRYGAAPGTATPPAVI
jgi:uncharacterized membrane protein YhaH (DUF805 family)